MSGVAAERSLSSSVGDYLKAIWVVGGSEPASTKDLADRLSVAPASVTNMLIRLQEMGFVVYERYHGATLTSAGREEALRLIRRHRLIETFLLEHLGYSWQEVHAEADKLEHAVSDLFTERLAGLLAHPGHDPHGDPIPAADCTLEPEETVSLGSVTAGESVRISRVSTEDPAALAHLGERGLAPGRWITVEEVRELDGVVTVRSEAGESHPLGGALAASIFVENTSRR